MSETIEFPKIETPRLQLGKMTLDHGADLFQIYGNAEAMKYYDIHKLANVEAAIEIIELYQKRFEANAGIRWGIFLESKLIGTCGYNKIIPKRKAVIGYDLNPTYWSQGFATEAVQSIIDFVTVEHEVHRIEAYVSPGNVGSEKVLKKCGFEKEGLLRDVHFFKGRFQDQYLYARINTSMVKPINQ